MKKLTISSSASASSLLDGICRRFFIDGSWVEPSGRDCIAVVDPATEIAEIAAGGPEDVDRAVAAAFIAHAQWHVRSVRARCSSTTRSGTLGGYKRSGNGREYGAHGLAEYLETKALMGFEPAAAVAS